MDHPSPSRRSWVKRGGLILLGVVAAGYVGVTLVVYFRKPVFESIDDVQTSQVQAITVFVLNRPDGGPDIGHPSTPFVIAPDDHGRVLDVFRKARRINESRTVWLGRLNVTLSNGRRQMILLDRVRPDPNGPWVLRFKVGEFQYEAGPVDDLVKVLVECEARAKGAEP